MAGTKRKPTRPGAIRKPLSKSSLLPMPAQSARVDQNKTVTDSELKTSIRVGGAKRPFKIMDLRVAH
jgi:hypothetical protein